LLRRLEGKLPPDGVVRPVQEWRNKAIAPYGPMFGRVFQENTMNDNFRDNYPWLAELEARERAIAIVQTEAAYAAGFLRNLASVIRESGSDLCWYLLGIYDYFSETDVRINI
jgi:hypothetical protein